MVKKTRLPTSLSFERKLKEPDDGRITRPEAAFEAILVQLHTELLRQSEFDFMIGHQIT